MSKQRSNATWRLFIVSLWLLTASSAFAQSQPDAYLTPLGIALEEYAYPFPVKYLALEVEGEPVRMAYMDVAPTGKANGRAVVLLHGKNFYGSYWENTIKALVTSWLPGRRARSDRIRQVVQAGHHLHLRSVSLEHRTPAR